jgi:hypothetical protein
MHVAAMWRIESWITEPPEIWMRHLCFDFDILEGVVASEEKLPGVHHLSDWLTLGSRVLISMEPLEGG